MSFLTSPHPIYNSLSRISSLSPALTGNYLALSFSEPIPYTCGLWTSRLTDSGREFLYSRIVVHYGLMQRCERQVLKLPDGSGGWEYIFTAFKCRDFPKRVSDRCEKENRPFCVEWTSAGYSAQLGVGFGAIALLALLIGVSTHSRRRRVWKAVAGLVTLNGA